MRSSKNRSRSKGNRNRSVGNIVNRVFDSSGPEGKVRGTPAQIIDKYNQLTRDAQLSNDRVAAENFQQHAEHYTRLLSEAQKEMDARREQQEAQQQNQNQNRRDRNQQGGGQGQGGGAPQGDQQQPRGESPQPDVVEQAPAEAAGNAFDDVIDAPQGTTDGPVQTPEEAPKPKRNRRRRAPDAEAAAAAPAGDGPSSPPEAAE